MYMRAIFTIAILLSCFTLAIAQPSNDECGGAMNLSLSTPPACPGGGSVSNMFNATNVDATSTVPYPSFTGCNPGGATDAPAAEVWFTFTATSNLVSISVTGGLSTPNLVLFTGPNCLALNAIFCAKAPNGSGALGVNLTLEEGQVYYLMVSGGNVNDQGAFTINIQSSRDCNPCLSSDNLVASPPPTNGTYASGTTVQFCYTVEEWDVNQSTVEWLHAVEVQLGPGWDPSSLVPTITPGSCDGNGAWGWYDFWVSSNTGQIYGPGFAYDSQCTSAPPNTFACTNIPLDGNPGNNWGDGGGNCAGIGTTTPPVTFCFSAQVSTCPPNNNGTSLSVTINPLSDGDSGGWVEIGCNTQSVFNFLASTTCCNDFDPIAAILQNPTCPGATDGNVQISANGGILTGSWSYRIFDESNNLVAEVDATGFPAVVNGLGEGNYSVQAINALSGCTRSTLFSLVATPPPTAIPSFQPACPGTNIQLVGSTDGFGVSISYFWTGPPGFTPSNLQNPTTMIEGIYTLVVTVDGCQSDPVTIDVQYENFFVSASANPTQVCVNSLVTLSANGNVDTYSWTNVNTGQPVGVGQTIQVLVTEATQFMVTGQSGAGCAVTNTVLVNIFDPPMPSVVVPNANCAGTPIVIDVVGGPFNQYQWSDNSTDPAPRILNLDEGTYTYSVTVTDFNNCVGASFPVNFSVSAVPNISISPEFPVVCSGDAITLTASGANSYTWSTNESGNSITVSPTTTTNYTVTGVGDGNCQNTANVTVSVETPDASPVVNCGTITPNSVTFELDASGYQVDVLTNQTGTLSGTTFTVDNLSPGEEVTIEVIAMSGNSCPNVSTTLSCTSQDCPVVDVEIETVADICLDTLNPVLDTLELTLTGETDGDTLWTGPGIIDSLLGVFDPVEADTGLHEIVVLYTEGDCVYTDTIEIAVFEIPSADFMISSDNICVGDTILIDYVGTADTMATFNWGFNGGVADPGTGIGPQTVSWNIAGMKTITLVVVENGCTSETFSLDVNVADPLPEPQISCSNSSTTSVEFSWPDIPGATGYTINVLTSQSGTQNNNTFSVTGLMPEETVTIEVIAETNNPCGSSSTQFSCSADPCPTFSINIDPVADICLDGMNSAFDLTASISGGQGNGTQTWSGPGITDAAAGTFDPLAAGAGTHTIIIDYDENPCSGSESIVINVFDTPAADFSVSPGTACIDQDVIILYEGSAGPGATFTWNFNGGDAQPGAGPGPHTVSWNTAGTKTVSLIVTENNCTSAQFSQTVEITAPLAAPVINCQTSTSSIEFNWADVAGADSYMVTVLTNQTGTLVDNTFTVDGLNPGETVTIEVLAVGSGPCGNSSNTASCVAEDCPSVSITFDPVDPICLDATAVPITLNATLIGGMGNGTATWDGNGITDQDMGIFDPVSAGVGDHSINYAYQEGNCVYNSSIVVVVNAQPTANFTVDDLICIDATSTVVYTGSADASANYNWDFDGGMANPGTGQGAHEVSWTTGGTKTISLTVTENDCTSEVFSQTVQVDAPLAAPTINCSSTNTSITFSWDDIPGAIGYQIVDVTGPAGVLNGTSYEVTGLNPGDAVTIQVIAEGTTICGTSMTEETCVAQDCPDFVFDIEPIADVCSDAGLQTFMATVAGGVGGGDLSWSGSGVDASGIFDPAMVNPGTTTLTVTYTEGICSESEMVMVTVFAVPTADFMVTNPICLTENALITYTGTASTSANYSWSFDGGTADPGIGAGPHTVTWGTSGTKTIILTVEENDCPSTEFSQTIEVDEPLTAPQVDCATTQTSITFSWPEVTGATGYSIIEVSGPSGTLNGATYTVSGLMPDDEVIIQVVALGDGACGDATSAEVSCTTDSCEAIFFDVVADLAFCADDMETNLVATAVGGIGNGTFTWSGEGITNPDGSFDPTIVTPGSIVLSINYEEGACAYDTTITVIVHQVPTADFSVTDPICIPEASTITYLGNASAGATYSWDFDGGVADPGTGQGPHTVTWPSGGMKEISLTVTENNCSSESVTQNIQVDEPLADPIISCTTDNTFIIFDWAEVIGATSYQVDVLSGQNGTLDGTTFTVDGLNPGDVVTIQVIAESDGACGNSMSEESCIAAVCPDISFEVTPVNDLCADDEIQTLSASTIGGVGGGTLTWSGPGIVDANGSFDPGLVIPGDISLNLEYVEDVCSYDTTIIVTVFAVPTADFVATSPICVSGTSTVTYQGSASTNATYDWDFGGGIATPGTGPGPHEVSWPAGGTQTVSLTVVENGCSSTPATQNVEVTEPLAEPVVVCAETTSTSITFSWEDVPGATSYEVEVLNGGPTGMMVGNTYVLDNLTPQQSVSIQVTALGNGPCGNIVGLGTCVAQDCPMVSLTLSGTEVICDESDADISFNFTGDSDGPFTVLYTINGSNETSAEVSNGSVITLLGLTETTIFEVLSITDTSLPDCVFPGNAMWEVQVNEPINAGTALASPEICIGVDSLVSLADLLENAAPNGQWVEVSAIPSDGEAFDPAAGAFNPMNQIAGTYTFAYQIDVPDPCPDVEVEVNVIVVPSPIADAGLDQELTCNMGMVSLGGSNTTGAVSFQWTANDENIMIVNPESQFIDASQPGTYTLTVVNEQGCTATDEVVILSNLDVPVAEVSLSQISCFQADDGGIFVDNVTGGVGPYEFSLNGAPLTSQTAFIPLGPNSYSLVIQDQNGCFSELTVDLSQPEELFVELTTNLEGNDNLIRLGDSVRLQASYNQGVTLDTIIWEPDSVAMGNTSSIWVSPVTTSNYSVTIIDENGCTDSDDMTIFVRKDRPVYIPNVFSPNGDQVNDVFYIQTGSNVRQINSFLVFNRWGETMIELNDFPANDPTLGWDGNFRGQAMNSGVYTYFAEVEFDDGIIILYEGDVTLLR